MANIQPRYDKTGKLISYSIRVHRGRSADGKQLRPLVRTFQVSPGWSEKTAERKARDFAAQLEAEYKAGTAVDTRLKFAEYADYVLSMKEDRGLIKHSTLVRYKELEKRITPEIGHIKLRDLRVDHLNTLYSKLGKTGEKHTFDRAKTKIDLVAELKKKKTSRAQIARTTGLAASTVSTAVKGNSVSREAAEKIAGALGMKTEKVFLISSESKPLSPKTIIEHHRFISMILEEAVNEGLIPFNVAPRATLPKTQKKTVNYFQPDQVSAIRDALETEPPMWKTLVHLFLITGARRGELLGLKWGSVDFESNRIHIENSILYNADVGVYESSPKTSTSIRWISLPQETMRLLRQWQRTQAEERLRVGEYWQDQGFVFCGEDGRPLHPGSVGTWLRGFSDRHSLPHINCHAFRHTMASMLYYNRVDTISISKRLGHASPSFTADVYAHIIESADQENAELLADIFLKRA